VGTAVFLDLGDARRRIGWYMDYYNFQRPHQGIAGLVPADRFFGAAPEVLETLKSQVAANALKMAQEGAPRKPFYVTGQVGGKTFSVHAEGDRVIMTKAGEERQEVELTSPDGEVAEPVEEESLAEVVTPQGRVEGGVSEDGNEAPDPPGVSGLDEGLAKIVALAEGTSEETKPENDSAEEEVPTREEPVEEKEGNDE
jgi:hypothetical protein